MESQALTKYALGVVIVNYRTADLVQACLTKLAPMLINANAGVVVVDNDSGDGSFELLARFCASLPESGRIRVVEAGGNNGFSAGNNIGVASIQADYILFLNSDAMARTGALKAILEAAARTPDAGLVTPRIVSSRGAAEVSRFRNHTPLSEFIDGAQTGPLTKVFPGAEVPIYPDDWQSTAGWVTFAAVLIKMDAINAAGPMDEGFFLYFEDCDYCRRIKAAGYSIIAAPKAVFIHDSGGSTKLRENEDRGARLPAYFYASRSRYFRKYYGPSGPVLANLAWYTGRLIARLRGLMGRAAPQVCKGRSRDIWIGWRGGAEQIGR